MKKNEKHKKKQWMLRKQPVVTGGKRKLERITSSLRYLKLYSTVWILLKSCLLYRCLNGQPNHFSLLPELKLSTCMRSAV